MKTAVSAGAEVAFPATGQNGFEDASVTTFAFPATWTSWTFTGAGIAANGSTVTASNPAAPEGTRVAFLPGVSSLETSFAFPAGVWRVTYRAAQRNFGSGLERQVVRVSIGGVEVHEELFESDQYVRFATRPVHLSSATTLTVEFEGLQAGHTALIDDVRLEPIADWSTNAAWGGTPPTSTDMVMIPNGIEVALTGASTGGDVHVHGELLATARTITLDADSVMVDGRGARFEVGLPLTPFLEEFTLTLFGAATPGTNSKFLMSMDGGTIEMHGTPRDFDAGGGRRRAWTHLGDDAAAGDTSIVMSQAVAWQAGDRVVIAGSNLFDPSHPTGHWDESEEVEIQSVGGGGTVLNLTQPLAFDHIGTLGSTATNGVRTWQVDQRAEVGLLTHNVRVHGDASSETSRWGAHVMMMRMSSGHAAGVGRFSSVEFFRVGQEKELGRYPLHWHMQLDAGTGQYAKSCGVRRSYNRAMTIHGSENVVLEGNVAYDHMGHGMFLEDGSERFNELYHNLALCTRRPLPADAMLLSDHEFAIAQNRAPATFWITNPNNEFVGNVAAGSVGTGFWFALPTAPTGLSASEAYFSGLQPDHEPLGLFEDNKTHSSGTGVDLHDTIDPSTHGVISNHRWLPTTSAPQYLDRFTAYGCSTALYGGATHNPNVPTAVDQIRYRDALLVDNGTHILFAGYDVVQDSCVIAQSGSAISPSITFGYTFYDGPGRVYDTHFDGYDGTNGSIFGHSGAAYRGVNHRFRNLTFDPPGFPPLALANYHVDPSLAGVVALYEISPGVFAGSLVNDTPLLVSASDVVYPVPHPFVVLFPAVVATPHWSTLKFANLRIMHPALTTGAPPYTSVPTIDVTRNLVGNAPTTLVHTFNDWAHRQVVVALNGPSQSADVDYDLDWASIPSSGPVQLVFDDMDTDWILPGSHVLLDLDPLGSIATLAVKSNGVTLTPEASVGALLAQTSTAYFVSGSTLKIKFVSTARRDVVELIW